MGNTNGNGRVMSSGQTLRRLFLMLFLRGRTSRGLTKGKAPKSIGRRLGFGLLFYALFGMTALSFIRQPVFAVSLFTHGMTLIFLGMFVATSAGEVLFNKEEADILLHRPVTPRAMLWAKITVLVQVALLPPVWFAGFDNALIGDGGASSWLLAAFGGAATVAVLWLAFGKLAHSYESGLQALTEASPARRRRGGRHWLGWLVKRAPLRWWLRNSVSRGAFLLTAAYLFRDRETKLRIYPGLAPMMIMPVIFL